MQAGADRDRTHAQRAWTDIMERVFLVSYGSHLHKVQIVSATKPDSSTEVQQLAFPSQ